MRRAHQSHATRVGWVGVDVSLFMSQLGYCVVYLIFVQQNLGPTLRRAFPSQPSWLTGTMALLLVQVRRGKARHQGQAGR